MSWKNLEVTEHEQWLEVAITRPAALNALDRDTMEEIDGVRRELVTREELRGMILTGGGEKAFVAGADISQLVGLDAEAASRYSRRGHEIFGGLANSPKPVLAAVNGFALGGGCELALACHLRIFSERAKIGLPEVSLGVIPGFGGTQRLARIVGLGRALEMLLTGDMIDATEAYRIGLANRVVPTAQLLETTRTLARSIDTRGPRAVSLALRAAVQGSESSLEDGLALEAAYFGLAAATADWREGTQAFLEKRKPGFSGR